MAFPSTTLLSLCLRFLSSDDNPFFLHSILCSSPSTCYPFQSLLSHSCIRHNIRQTHVDFPHYLPSLILLRGSKSERNQAAWLMMSREAGRPLSCDGSSTLDSKASKLKLNLTVKQNLSLSNQKLPGNLSVGNFCLKESKTRPSLLLKTPSLQLPSQERLGSLTVWHGLVCESVPAQVSSLQF